MSRRAEWGDAGRRRFRGRVVQVIEESAWKDYFGVFAPVDVPPEAKGRRILNIVPEAFCEKPWWRRFGRRPEWQYAVITDRQAEVGDVVDVAGVAWERADLPRPMEWITEDQSRTTENDGGMVDG